MARPSNTTAVAKRVFQEIRKRGVLLHHGGEFPSITTLVCGTPVSGSWWSHPKSNLIYWVMQELDECPDVAAVKLINGKVTSVHRSWWSALYAIGAAREPWQTNGLTSLARSMLRKTDQGALRVDQYRTRSAEKPTDAARALEKRLLVHTHEMHTQTGKHTKVLTSWEDWRRANDLDDAIEAMPIAAAKARFEALVDGYKVKLAW